MNKNKPMRACENSLKIASDLTGVPISNLVRLHNVRLLDEEILKEYAIRHEYRQFYYTGKYDTDLIISRLAIKHNLSKIKVKRIINKSYTDFGCYCNVCGKQIAAHENDKYDGMCESCAVHMMKL